jgi:hypothetical protein
MAHYQMADTLESRGRFLGVPVILLTALIGTGVLASVATDVIPNGSKIVAGLLSLAASVLSSLQTFFNYSDRAEKHRNSAARFGVVRRKLENLYAQRSEAISQQLVDSLRQELDALAQESPRVPGGVFRKVQERPLYVGDANSIRSRPITSEGHGA